MPVPVRPELAPRQDPAVTRSSRTRDGTPLWILAGEQVHALFCTDDPGGEDRGVGPQSHQGPSVMIVGSRRARLIKVRSSRVTSWRSSCDDLGGTSRIEASKISRGAAMISSGVQSAQQR